MSNETDATKLFSDRVDVYTKFRPNYPKEVVATLLNECALSSTSAVADVGSGTGKFTSLLLEYGFPVYAVEPNTEMREAAELDLGDRKNYQSVAGTSERTTLDTASMDLVTVAQAFHWFEPEATRREFARILQTGGQVALIWNQRKLELPFQLAYHELLTEYAPRYRTSHHTKVDEDAIETFFSPGDYHLFAFQNGQSLNLEGLRGRMMSSSYTPVFGQAGYEELMSGVEAIFTRHAENGRIDFEYETRLFLGSLAVKPLEI